MYKQRSYKSDDFGHLIFALIWQAALGLTFVFLPLCRLANYSNALGFLRKIFYKISLASGTHLY